MTARLDLTCGARRHCWHYTTGQKFAAIVRDGYLRPSAVGIGVGEAPINWFSRNQWWEATAAKGFLDRGRRRRATMDEMQHFGGGLVRFGISAEILVPWPTIGRQAQMGLSLMAQLEHAGQSVGGNPAEWAGALSHLPVADLTVEVLENGRWKRVTVECRKTSAASRSIHPQKKRA